MKHVWLALSILAGFFPAPAATRVLVTVVDEKTLAPIADCKAEDFTITDGGRTRSVEKAEYSIQPVDVMMLVDTSLVGNAVQPVAADLINLLQDKEQMALISYHNSADLIQDFTASKNSLLRALSQVKYGNAPQALDAIYAAADGGFENTPLRKIILLLTSGVEGPSRMDERDVIKLARKRGISIFSVYLSGQERWLFQDLAAQTGGAAINIQQLSKELGKTGKPAERVFEAIRGHYLLTLSGNLALGEKVKAEVKRPPKSKAIVTLLPLE